MKCFFQNEAQPKLLYTERRAAPCHCLKCSKLSADDDVVKSLKWFWLGEPTGNQLNGRLAAAVSKRSSINPSIHPSPIPNIRLYYIISKWSLRIALIYTFNFATMLTMLFFSPPARGTTTNASTSVTSSSTRSCCNFLNSLTDKPLTCNQKPCSKPLATEIKARCSELLSPFRSLETKGCEESVREQNV